MHLFRRGIVGAGQWCFIANVTTPYEVLFCEKDGTRAKKNPHFCAFLVFSLVSSTRAQWNQENFVKSVVKSSYKARESWCKAREAVFKPLVVIKVPI